MLEYQALSPGDTVNEQVNSLQVQAVINFNYDSTIVPEVSGISSVTVLLSDKYKDREVRVASHV